MKKTLLLLVFGIVSLISSAQEINFPKSHYADSIAVAKHLPELAQKMIPLYKDSDLSQYKDNLFRLHLVAQNYDLVAPTIREIGQVIYSDSTDSRGLGFSFRVFANVLASKPASKAVFEKSFQQQFHKIYDVLDDKNKNMVEQYYERDLSQLKKDFDDKLTAALNANETITITDAVALCRSYCSYFTFSNTLTLGRKELQIVADEKYIVNENEVITMADGGTIALTIVRNKRIPQALPVVFMFNIYAGADLSRCKEAADKGFVGVIANTRGKRLSKDEIEPFEHDASDAYQIIDWISKQSWCDGKVGMYGGSYLGFSQWSAMKKPHPALKTIVPMVAVGTGVDYPMQNGVFMCYSLQWIHFVCNNKLTDFEDFGDTKKWSTTFTNYFKEGKAFRDLDKIDGRPNAIFQRWLSHPTFDSYWKNMTPTKEEFANINIPILGFTGYFDDDQIGALYYYHQYQKYNTNNNYYLVIGPFDHFGSQGYPAAELNGYTIDKEGLIPINALVFEWFNYQLKDGKKPEFLKDKVNFEIMGKNEWRHVQKLSAMHNDELTFYLGEENKKMKLLTAKPKTLKAISQTVDFKDRSECRPYGMTDLNGIEKLLDTVYRPDKQFLVFESDAIESPLAISGELKASLKISCNKKDMDIAIQLVEKTADGHYFILNNNLQRASYVMDSDQRKLLQPNKIETITMNRNYITCKQLEKGSKVIIAIGVHKNPNWQVNYGSGKDVSDETMEDAKIPLEVKWYNDSSIVIPVLR